MKLPRLIRGLFFLGSLIGLKAAASSFLLPPSPNNQADGYVRVTWGSPLSAGLGIAPENSYFTTDIQPGGSGVPTPPIPPVRYATWCLDMSTDIEPGGPTYYTVAGTMYGGVLISSQDPTLNSQLPDHPNVKHDAATWNRINWVINNRRVACNGLTPTMWEVQHAFSKLLGQATITPEPTWRPAVVDCLVNSAYAADAAGWTPSCGDKIAVIFNIDVNWNLLEPDVQLLFLEVPFLCVNCPSSCGFVGQPYASAISATGGTVPYNFSLFSGSLPAGLTLDATSGAITGSPTAAGSYSFTVKVTDSSSPAKVGYVSCGINTYAPITVNSGETCAGGSVTLTASPIPAGGTVIWDTAPPTTGASITVSPASTTTYHATLTTGEGCSYTAQGTAKINPMPTISVGDQSICGPGNVTLTAVHSPGTILWSTGATSDSITVAVSGDSDFSVTVTSADGCTATAKAHVTVLSVPTISVSDQSICGPGNVTLTATHSAGTILWSTGATTDSITVAVSGDSDFTVTVMSSNGCTASAAAHVTVYPQPHVTAGDVSACATPGQTVTLTASVTPPGSWTYLWSNGEATPSIEVPADTAGTFSYSVTVTGPGGCKETAFANVIVSSSGACANSCVQFTKTADAVTAQNGAQMGYTYTVVNCGNTVFNNLAIIDDAGTPDYPGDDFTVEQNITLNPGETKSYHVVVSLPVPECSGTGGTGPSAGTLITQILPGGDVKVTFRQSRNLNDNVYGAPAAADGWSSHTFGNLTGSDKAEFRFTDGKGNVVLDFYQDYVSATNVSAAFPSGYASLGPNGGDGSMITGAKTNVLWWTSTLADSLNNTPPFSATSPYSAYTVNSPTPEASFPTWDYVDGYTVIVSHYAFGANGFGGVTIPYVHNSPAKTGNNQVSPTPCGACIENIARLVLVNGQTITSVLASDNAVVCTGNPAPPPPPCILTHGALKIDKNTIQLPIKNNGTSAIYLTELDLTWLQSINGKLKKVTLNGDVWVGLTSSPISLISGFTTDPNKRKIDKGQTKTLVLQFEKNASKVLTDYSGGTVKFGTDSSCAITFLP